MKAVFFDIENIPFDESLIKSALPGWEISLLEGPLTAQTAASAADADIVSVFVSSSVTREAIDAIPNLKAISTRSTGTDHIDVAYATERGIPVLNVAGYGEHTVAEFAFAMLFSLTRKVHKANEDIVEGKKMPLREYLGTDLFGKTLSVIGTGRIGRKVAEIGRAFGMSVIAYDVYPNAEHAAAFGYRYAPLEEALGSADVISLHVPSTPETLHLMNAERFALLKKGVYLVNTARGDVIDTDALVAAVADGTLAGVALDVVEGEKKGIDPRVLAEPRILTTPHIAFCSVEAVATINASVVAGLVAFASK